MCMQLPMHFCRGQGLTWGVFCGYAPLFLDRFFEPRVNWLTPSPPGSTRLHFLSTRVTTIQPCSTFTWVLGNLGLHTCAPGTFFTEPSPQLGSDLQHFVTRNLCLGMFPFLDFSSSFVMSTVLRPGKRVFQECQLFKKKLNRFLGSGSVELFPQPSIHIFYSSYLLTL